VAAPVAPQTDLRSAAVRSGEVKFRLDGKVDQRCAAVKDGSVLVRGDGHVDQRSKLVRSGDVSPKPSITTASQPVAYVATPSYSSSYPSSYSSYSPTPSPAHEWGDDLMFELEPGQPPPQQYPPQQDTHVSGIFSNMHLGTSHPNGIQPNSAFYGSNQQFGQKEHQGKVPPLPAQFVADDREQNDKKFSPRGQNGTNKRNKRSPRYGSNTKQQSPRSGTNNVVKRGPQN